jgi:hypothetical protein
MNNYDTGEGMSEEENEASMALFTSDDLFYFEEDVKSSK